MLYYTAKVANIMDNKNIIWINVIIMIIDLILTTVVKQGHCNILF